jgi:uncharacterized membrane protein
MFIILSTQFKEITKITRILCSWNIGMTCFLGLTWGLMLTATPDTMRYNAQKQDVGRNAILSLVLVASCISLLSIVFILNFTQDNSTVLNLTLSVATIIGSWLLVHTIFALHYAHKYYQESSGNFPERNAEGLSFPDDRDPDYWDFLYFSLVIGMTGQVSDVQITSRPMRRLALFHGMLSFFFNTTIVAITMNIIAGLLQQLNAHPTCK